ncbi:MAG: hypothetical protein Q4D16_20160 [Eubacteriales bacterium]|nr:hypothetical protein [Eubacteriales bacterium]
MLLLIAIVLFIPSRVSAGNPSALSEAKASEQALGFLKNMYDDLTDVQVTNIVFDEAEGIQKSFYIVDFTDDNNSYYQVEISAETGELEYILLEQQGIDFQEESFPLNDIDFDDLYKKGKEIFRQVRGEDCESKSSTCEYNITKENTIPHGNINFLFELNNGDAVRLLYNVNNDVFWNLTYISYYQSYRNQQDANESYRQDLGITRNIMDMTGK